MGAKQRKAIFVHRAWVVRRFGERRLAGQNPFRNVDFKETNARREPVRVMWVASEFVTGSRRLRRARGRERRCRHTHQKRERE